MKKSRICGRINLYQSACPINSVCKEARIKKNPSPAKLPLTQLEHLIRTELDARKAEEILSIDLTGKADFADRMIIANGTSARHVASMADNLVHALKNYGFESVPTEGMETADWVLVDAGDIIVHLFRPEVRKLYNLEKMWSVSLPEPKPAPKLAHVQAEAAL